MPGGLTDIRGFSEARGQVLSMKLDKMSDSVSGQTVVDPKGYLTSLSSQSSTVLGAGGEAADVADIKKARLLMKSIITTNPGHGPGWIAAARLEEQVRNLPQARKLIKEGCEHCPQDEDVWLEAARLQPSSNAKFVLADAVKSFPHSVKIWLFAADLEQEAEAKKAVLRKALTLIPASEKLWKAAISLEGPDDAKIMLARAVECVPTSIDLWLALARLETYQNAQKVLNQSRQAIPADPTIWIAAAKLEEAQGHTGTGIVDKIVNRALKSMATQQLAISRESWLKHAEDAEKSQAPTTAAAIVTATAEVDVEEADRKRTWLADADAFAEKGLVVCARAVYSKLLSVFSDREGIWQKAATLEKKQGTRDSLDALLQRAVAACPSSEILWLMTAKERWLNGDVSGARNALKDAFAINPKSEAIWLAAAKLEWQNNELERARALLARARSAAPSARVHMKSALLERECGDSDAEEKLLKEGCYSLFPSSSSSGASSAKLWMMLGQLYERLADTNLKEATSSNSAAGAVAVAAPNAAASASASAVAAAAQRAQRYFEQAKETYHAALRHNPDSATLWLLSARLEERLYGAAKARTVLETARLRIPKYPELYLESIRLERRSGQEKLAENLMSRALQDCPLSGALWAEDILTASKTSQKRKSVEALKRCDNDARVVLAVGQLFWADKKYDKARKWFHRACALDPGYGDAWIYWFAFELHHGTKETAEDVEKRCVTADPAHGERWQRTAKSHEMLLKKGSNEVVKAAVLKRAVIALKKEEAANGAGSLWDQKPANMGFTATGSGSNAAGDAEDGEAAAAAAAPASSSAGASSAASAGVAGYKRSREEAFGAASGGAGAGAGGAGAGRP